MTLSLGHTTRTSSNILPWTFFLRHHTHSPLPHQHGPCCVFSATELRSSHRRRPPQRGEQVRLPCGSSLPLSRLLRASPNCTFHHSRCQISFLLPHPSPLLAFQKKLLIPRLGSFSAFPLSPFHHEKFPFLNNSKTFASDADSGLEEDCDGRGVSGESCVDLDEVARVCKVIDELFALDRNMEAVLDDCGVQLSHDLVVGVLQRFKHARKPAFRFFCWAGKRPGFAHDSRTYNCMMSVLGRTRQFETMVALLEEMGEKGFLTMDTFSIAIKAFAEAKQRKKAVGIFDLMKRHGFKVGVDVINFLLESLGAAKLGKEAQAVFEKLRDRFTPNLQTYTILLSGWCRLKNMLEAGRVWNEMIDGGFKPDIVAHNVMLEGLLKCKKSDAIKLFEIMKAKGPSPNVRSYTIIIQDFCKQKMTGEAIKYFDEMVDRGCQPDVALYTCLITGFGRQKKMDMVYNLLKEMRERGCSPDGRTYNALIKLMTSQHMPDDAVRIYKKMIQSGIEPTIHSYNMIMKSYFMTKNYEMGHVIWDEMHQKGCCPDDNSYAVLIGGLIRQDRSGDACRYLEEMLEKGMKAPQLDYNKFASDISKTGNTVILEELARKMNFVGKFEVSNTLASWVDMMKKNAKRREPTASASQFI